MKCPKSQRLRWLSVRSATSAGVARALLSWRLLILAMPLVLGGLLQACGGGGRPAPVPSNIQSITIDPINPTVAVSTSLQLHATVNNKNGTTKDVTESATWVSADPTVANVSNAAGSQGLTSGASVGATTITASFGGVSGTTTFTVTNASLKSITVVPVNPMIARGTTVQLTATGNFSDGSVQDLTTQVSWSSGNSGIATVSTTPGSQGLATGVSVGNTPITATFDGVSGSTTVTVSSATVTSITVTPPLATITKGTTLQLTATCNLSDGATQDCTGDVSWASSSSSIAKASDTSPTKGLVSGVGVGTATITASFSGQQGTATVTVTNATLTSIEITPPDPSIVNGSKVGLTATGKFSDGMTQDLTTQVSWTSSDETIAQVSNVVGTQGLVTGLAVGSTSITAVLNGVSGSTTVTVIAATLTSITITPDSSIANGTTEQLTATGNYSDGTTQDLTDQVSWTSGNDAIEQVSNVPGTQGLVTGLAVGSTSITAELNGVSGSTTVTVIAATLTSITITPPDPSVASGTTEQLTATGNYSDKTTQDLTIQVSWTSSDETIAQVSNVPGTQGLVTGLAVGSTSTTAELNGVSGSTTVTVTAPTLTSMSGQVVTGSVPISGSQVTLYQVGSSYGGAPTALSSSTSDSSGNFLFDSFVCPSSNAQVYAVAVGGNPGSATPPSGTESPIALMAALGSCGALPATIVINEVSTVASVYALAQFFNTTVTLHIPAIGAPSTDATGLTNGAALITTNLVDITSGAAGSFLSSGVNSPANLDSLANILAACVVSNSQSSSPCNLGVRQAGGYDAGDTQ
jgi:trimeric autotransporter adhesin